MQVDLLGAFMCKRVEAHNFLAGRLELKTLNSSSSNDNNYPIDYKLNEEEQSILMVALRFHPGEDEKNPKFENSRCFLVVRTDGSVADFSYHKCIVGALEIIAPSRVEDYKKKWTSTWDKKRR